MLSVIIPTKNSANLLRQFLPKNLGEIVAAVGGQDAYEVVIVDGGSDDDTQEFIKTLNNKNLRFCAHPKPGGYGDHCNFGVAHAKYEYICILTTDVALTRNAIADGLDRLTSNASIFGVVPPIIRVKEAGLNESFTSATYKRAEIRLRHGFKERDVSERCKVLWPCGAVFFSRTDTFKELGGFSSEYSPGYCEDVDLGIRAWQAGFESWYEPTEPCLHWHNSTMQKQENVRYLLSRNHFLLNLQYLPSSITPFFILRRIYKLLRRPSINEFKAILHGFRLFLQRTNKPKRFNSQKSLHVFLSQFSQNET